MLNYLYIFDDIIKGVKSFQLVNDFNDKKFL